ncbi:hypothetical protein J6590_017050 [Homalodisca vitripennis]|nr:hypothetical protein J6590_017050 [Homalodisca vitripennis]
MLQIYIWLATLIGPKVVSRKPSPTGKGSEANLVIFPVFSPHTLRDQLCATESP